MLLQRLATAPPLFEDTVVTDRSTPSCSAQLPLNHPDRMGPIRRTSRNRQCALQIVLSSPRIAPVKERYCQVRIKPDRLVEILDAAVVLAFAVIGGATAVERLCVVRIFISVGVVEGSE